MIILKSKHEKVVAELEKKIADYQKLLYYRAIAEQITMGEGIVVTPVLNGMMVLFNPQHCVKCLLWDDTFKVSVSINCAQFPTEYEANELKDRILDNEVIKDVISQLKFMSTAAYELPTLNIDFKQQFETYEDLFCAWTENIEQILNETKV